MPSIDYTAKMKKKYGVKKWRKMETERKKKWDAANPERKKAANDKWNEKNRNEYMRQYRLKQKNKKK